MSSICKLYAIKKAVTAHSSVTAFLTNGLLAYTLGVQSDNQSYFFHVRYMIWHKWLFNSNSTTLIIYVLIGTRKVLFWVVNNFRRDVVPLIRRCGQINPALRWSIQIGRMGSLCSVFPLHFPTNLLWPVWPWPPIAKVNWSSGTKVKCWKISQVWQLWSNRLNMGASSGFCSSVK